MKGGLMGQRHSRLVVASCCIWLLTVVALVSCQNAPDVATLRGLATEGDAAAQFDLGDRYFTGAGVPQDNGEALRWFRLAADQGHARAQASLGFMYAKGEGVPQDDGEAARWYRLAADQGYAAAQFSLGVMYRNGRGVPQDDGEALRWFRLAADQGQAGAQSNLGLMYGNGRGVPQDDGEAARWYRLAADQGYAAAQFSLGLMYGAGRGLPQDYVVAHKWANLAAAQGHENARELRATLAEAISAAERPATSPTETPCIPTELSPAAVELVRLYEELHTFKDDPEFLDFGFSRAGPYSAWMQAVEKHQDENLGFELSDELGFLTNDVLMLGMDYMNEEFSESDLRAIEYFEGRIQAGLAAARCIELGSVQETIQAASEARLAYVDPMSRPPAEADDFDERVVNPCIAAGIARNPELDGVTPWEVRNIYPEIYDPLVAQMRANVAPMLAEFGDDAGARNILLDRFRDDCIRGAGGETEIVDWSEAQVRELLSLSQQEATQYEIPLLNVNGEPYFPGERCDSPWIEHTPIASWMDPSDIGWLCESAPASEYVSTPGSARFCYTTGGERGWEQGFFGCKSAPDARQRALRNNADWLQGWTRSQ